MPRIVNIRWNSVKHDTPAITHSTHTITGTGASPSTINPAPRITTRSVRVITPDRVNAPRPSPRARRYDTPCENTSPQQHRQHAQQQLGWRQIRQQVVQPQPHEKRGFAQPVKDGIEECPKIRCLPRQPGQSPVEQVQDAPGQKHDAPV